MLVCVYIHLSIIFSYKIKITLTMEFGILSYYLSNSDIHIFSFHYTQITSYLGHFEVCVFIEFELG